MLGLQPRDIEEIKKIVSAYSQVEQIIIFGSRAKGNFSRGSDVDIALKGKDISTVLWKIHDELEEESSMPYFFDVVDYHALNNKELIDHIDRIGVVI